MTDWYAFRDQVVADCRARREAPPALPAAKPLSVLLSDTGVFDFFEGLCPNTNCRGELDVIEVSGIPEFLRWHGPDHYGNRTGRQITSSVWKPSRDGLGDRGVIIAECLSCGRAWEVYGVAGDDWAPGF